MTKLSMECKKMMVKEISDRLNNVGTLIVTNYKGLSSQDLNNLRRELREFSGEYVVVKDSIIKRAISEGPNSKALEFIEGEVGIVVDKKEDPSRISKILTEFSKDRSALKIRGGIMNGKLLSIDDIKILAALPSREALLSALANVLNAPMQRLAGALNAIICKFLYALNAIKDKKEKEGDKPKAEGKIEEKKVVPSNKQEEKTQEVEKKREEKKEEPTVENKQEPKTENRED